MSAPAPSMYRPSGSLNVATALAPYAGTWDRRLAAHLLRRAGFGGNASDVTRLASLPPMDAVTSLTRFADTSALPKMPAMENLALRYGPAGRPRNPGMGGFGMGLGRGPVLSDEEKRARNKLIRQADNRANLALQQWWLDRMIATPAPLQEKLTLFYHGHFTSARPGKGVMTLDMAVQNDLFRQNALGNFRALTLAVSQDPAMLMYLDNARSEKSHPNENYARELMELFTLGIGNYTEQDVRESARAFSGWQVRRGEGFVYNAAQHDTGSKTFLGQTGDFDGKDIVRIIFQQPAAATFLATKLIEYFVYEDPEPDLVNAYAAVIRKHDFEMGPIVSTLLRSNVFFSDRAYRALVKSPVEFVVGTYQAFGVAQTDVQTTNALRRMGQVLFYPPNVKGWDGGAAWLNSQTMLTRENFASGLMSGKTPMQAAWLTKALRSMNPPDVARILTDSLLYGDVSTAANAKLVSYLAGADDTADAALSGENVDLRVRGAAYLTMAMPAYQLN